MELLELMKKRYSCRKFSDKCIPKELIHKILESARLSPTAVNFEPQKILVLESNDSLEKLKKCTNSHFCAPLAFIISYDKNICWKREYDNHLSGEVDAAIITTHMMLMIEELGLGATWVMHFDPQKLKEEFSLKDNIIPVAILPCGYKAIDSLPSPRHSIRKNIDEFTEYI
ncbi:nitroreductase family protein [bacterium]|nr:nitroreductase family protein [bacterium]